MISSSYVSPPLTTHQSPATHIFAESGIVGTLQSHTPHSTVRLLAASEVSGRPRLYRQWEVSLCRRGTDGVMADTVTVTLSHGHSQSSPSLVLTSLTGPGCPHWTIIMLVKIRVRSEKWKNSSKKGDQESGCRSILSLSGGVRVTTR